MVRVHSAPFKDREMDIIIYTNAATAFHKLEPGQECYWGLKNPPRNFKEGNRIYIAFEGMIRGYFICNGFDPDDPEETVCWDSDSWKSLYNACKTWQFGIRSFQGFKYKFWPDEDDVEGE